MIRKFPQEIATFYVIPAVRRAFVKEMLACGLSQKQAASKLGLTEAAVSQYVKDKRASEVKLNDNITERIMASAARIMDGKSDAFTEMYRIVSECEKDLTTCKIHMMFDDIPEGCNVCLESGNSLVQISPGKKLQRREVV